jgi:uncharacterized membrane protein (UPF0136 family)
MRPTILLVLNSITFILMLLLNYLTGTGALNNASVGEISDQYHNLFTPAGYTFAIWGLIYLLLFVFVGYQWYVWIKKRDDEYIKAAGIWFIMSNLANGMWIIAWTNDQIGLSLILIIFLLVSLVMLMFRLRLEIWDAPVRIIAFVWWPVCIYLGWIIVATMANIAAFSVSLNPVGAFALRESWVIVMIVFAAVIYGLLIYFRNMREAAMVGIWALVAIAVNQWHTAQSVGYAALIASAALLIYSLLQAYRNRETLPQNKIRRGEI